MEEFFKVGAVEDAVCSGFRVVDDELVLRDGLGGGGFGLERK
jgi:hypothetical protein